MSTNTKTVTKVFRYVLSVLKDYQSEKRSYSRNVRLRPEPTEDEILTIASYLHYITKNNSLHDFSLKIGISTDSDTAVIELENRFLITKETESLIASIELILNPPPKDDSKAFDIKTTSVLLRD